MIFSPLKILPVKNKTKQNQLQLFVGLNSNLQIFSVEWGGAWVERKIKGCAAVKKPEHLKVKTEGILKWSLGFAMIVSTLKHRFCIL